MPLIHSILREIFKKFHLELISILNFHVSAKNDKLQILVVYLNLNKFSLITISQAYKEKSASFVKCAFGNRKKYLGHCILDAVNTFTSCININKESQNGNGFIISSSIFESSSCCSLPALILLS